jgi:predicted DNA-binding transcriptional regulator AlpA
VNYCRSVHCGINQGGEMTVATVAEKPELMTRAEIAAFFRVGLTTIDAWRRQGKLPPGRKIGRATRWDAREIRRLAGLDDFGTTTATDPK